MIKKQDANSSGQGEKQMLFSRSQWVNKSMNKQKGVVWPSKRWGHQAVIYQKYMYVVGGTGKDNVKDFVYRVDCSTFQWEKIICAGPKPEPRDSHSISKIDKKLYMFGGSLQDTLNQMWILDLTTHTWKKVQCKGDIPSPRQGHSSNVIDERFLLIMGGFNNETKTIYDDIYLYDSVSSHWRIIEKRHNDTISSRESFTSTLINGHIYIFAGQGNSVGRKDIYYNDLYRITVDIPKNNIQNSSVNIMEVQPTTDILPSVRASHTASSFKDRYLVVIGGQGEQENGSNSSGGAEGVIKQENDEEMNEENSESDKSESEICGKSDVWIFDTFIQTWTEIHPKTKNGVFLPRFTHTCAVYKDKLIIFGGMRNLKDILDELIYLNLQVDEEAEKAVSVNEFSICSICQTAYGIKQEESATGSVIKIQSGPINGSGTSSALVVSNSMPVPYQMNVNRLNPSAVLVDFQSQTGGGSNPQIIFGQESTSINNSHIIASSSGFGVSGSINPAPIHGSVREESINIPYQVTVEPGVMKESSQFTGDSSQMDIGVQTYKEKIEKTKENQMQREKDQAQIDQRVEARVNERLESERSAYKATFEQENMELYKKLSETHYLQIKQPYMSIALLNNISNMIAFPFSAFGLIIDHSFSQNAKDIDLSLVETSDDDQPYLKFSDNAIPYPEQTFFDFMYKLDAFNYSLGEEEKESDLETLSSRKGPSEVNRLSKFSTAQIGLLRLGETLLWIQRNGPFLTVAYVSSNPKYNTNVHSMEVLMFTYDLQKKIFLNDNAQNIFSNIYSNLELIFFRQVSYENLQRLDHGINFFAKESEGKTNVIFVFDLQRVPGKNNRQLFELFYSVQKNDIFLRVQKFTPSTEKREQIEKLVDYSLRSFLANLYISSQRFPAGESMNVKFNNYKIDLIGYGDYLKMLKEKKIIKEIELSVEEDSLREIGTVQIYEIINSSPIQSEASSPAAIINTQFNTIVPTEGTEQSINVEAPPVVSFTSSIQKPANNLFQGILIYYDGRLLTRAQTFQFGAQFLQKVLNKRKLGNKSNTLFNLVGYIDIQKKSFRPNMLQTNIENPYLGTLVQDAFKQIDKQYRQKQNEVPQEKKDRIHPREYEIEEEPELKKELQSD